MGPVSAVWRPGAGRGAPGLCGAGCLVTGTLAPAPVVVGWDRGVLVALDPGLDEVGYAVVAPGRPPRLWRIGTWYCPPGAALGLRLRRHGEQLRALLAAARQVTVVLGVLIERPATSTVYAAHRAGGPRQQTKMARSREVQELVTGVLWAVAEAAGAAAEFAAPVGRRWRTVEHLTLVCPDLPRTSEHARAALALALGVLGDERRRRPAGGPPPTERTPVGGVGGP